MEGKRPAVFDPPGELVRALQAAIRAETGLETQLSNTGGTHDGRFIAKIYTQGIECGPPNATSCRAASGRPKARLEAVGQIYWERKAQDCAASPDTVLRLTVLHAEGGRRCHFGRVLAEHHAHAATAGHHPFRDAAAVKHRRSGRRQAGTPLDDVGAGVVVDSGGHLRTVAANEFGREVIPKIDARRYANGGVLVRHSVALAVAEVAVVKIKRCERVAGGVDARQRVREQRGTFVRTLNLHLENSALSAVLGLQLHHQTWTFASDAESLILKFNKNIAGERQAAVLRQLADKDGRLPAACYVKLVGCTRECVVANA